MQGLIDRGQGFVNIPGAPQRVEVAPRGDRRQARPFAVDEAQIDAKGMRRQKNVGKENGGVESVAANRLKCDLGGQIAVVTQGKKIAGLFADSAVFGQVSPRLAHHPDGRRFLPFSGKGPENLLLRSHGRPPFRATGRLPVSRCQASALLPAGGESTPSP